MFTNKNIKNEMNSRKYDGELKIKMIIYFLKNTIGNTSIIVIKISILIEFIKYFLETIFLSQENFAKLSPRFKEIIGTNNAINLLIIK